MPAEEINSLIIPAAAGGGMGLIGGLLSALAKSTSPRQTAIALIGGMSFGATIPAAGVSYFNLPPWVAALFGLVSGLTVYGLLALSQKLSERIGRSDPVQVAKDVAAHRVPAFEPEIVVIEKKIDKGEIK